MTTPQFNRLAGPTALAMNTAYQRHKSGESTGTFKCPKCGSAIKFTFADTGRTTGRCAAAQCVRWDQ